jgi:hypothetical protein
VKVIEIVQLAIGASVPQLVVTVSVGSAVTLVICTLVVVDVFRTGMR